MDIIKFLIRMLIVFLSVCQSVSRSLENMMWQILELLVGKLI